MSAPRWAIAAFAAAMATFGVLSAVYLFAGDGTYRDLMRDRGPVTFVLPNGGTLTTEESGLVVFHRRTLSYVLGSASEPAQVTSGVPLFDANERSHLADVRAVFGGVRLAWLLSGLALAGLLLRSAMRGWPLHMVRAGALAAGAAVLVVGLVAALAFEPAFLAFHRVFFPQGNFLFDPATSSLLRLYPEAYWYGVTLRVGASVVALAAAAALAATLATRARPRASERSGIVSTR